ncbi:caspase-3-like [Anneissia japonica]|uniref:caspase-3-like n=1 Tax=Anneissia japonica TaxID=1529436 RepID=UPI0014258417|nr:caspase-3-like [Anneissia japonica]
MVSVLVDKRNISRFFKDREFTFKFFEDTRTPEELWEIIDDVKKDAENSSSFFFIISSHGKGITLKNESGGAELHKDTQKPVVISEEIRLVETNAYVRVDEIVSKFEHFMIGKPKVLIFQACRNLPELQPVRDRADDGLIPVDVDDAVRYYSAIIPGNADMVVVHDTSRGDKAYRNKEVGAWLFNELFVNLNERFKTEHLLDVLTRLNNRISKHKNHDGKAGLQMSCFISTLTKFFYLTN